ncbi:MAG: hypothetical protein KAI43_08975 [Candidatus Aureabacteria bacterium]|nr:hypothetical protein [Candidatus Auribacterota bacterium]
MKKNSILILSFFYIIVFFPYMLCAQVDVPFNVFYVYKDRKSELNHFYPTGWMGDTKTLKIKDDVIIEAKTMNTCIRIAYEPKKSINNSDWAGVYWQNPQNNWGKEEGSFDFTGAKKLTFLAKGMQGGEVVSKFQLGGISGEFPDSSTKAIYNVKLDSSWRQYCIKIEKEDLSCISGGFCIILTKRDNPEGMTFFIDEIKYE